MKRIILIVMTCLTLSTYGQTKTGSDISNTKTDKHVNIPGTRLYIIPPSGFEIATSFTGLQKGEDIAVQIFDLVGGNYYTNAATFGREKFEKTGAKVFEYKEFKINGFPAKYVSMEGDSKAIGFVFGDTTFSTMIMAIYPPKEDQAEKEIQKAIQSIYYDKNLKIDPFATASFTLDESKSNFKFSSSSGGIFVYTVGGASKESVKDQPVVIVIRTPRDGTMTGKNISEALISSLEEKGLVGTEVKNISTANVNGQPAYEVEVYGKMANKSSLIYQLIVSGEEQAIIIQGVVNSDFDTNLKEIKKLAKTIKLK